MKKRELNKKVFAAFSLAFLSLGFIASSRDVEARGYKRTFSNSHGGFGERTVVKTLGSRQLDSSFTGRNGNTYTKSENR